MLVLVVVSSKISLNPPSQVRVPPLRSVEWITMSRSPATIPEGIVMGSTLEAVVHENEVAVLPTWGKAAKPSPGDQRSAPRRMSSLNSILGSPTNLYEFFMHCDSSSVANENDLTVSPICYRLLPFEGNHALIQHWLAEPAGGVAEEDPGAAHVGMAGDGLGLTDCRAVGQRAGIQAREHLAAPHLHGAMTQVVDEPRPAVERAEQRPARRRVIVLAAVDGLR